MPNQGYFHFLFKYTEICHGSTVQEQQHHEFTPFGLLCFYYIQISKAGHAVSSVQCWFKFKALKEAIVMMGRRSGFICFILWRTQRHQSKPKHRLELKQYHQRIITVS